MMGEDDKMKKKVLWMVLATVSFLMMTACGNTEKMVGMDRADRVVEEDPASGTDEAEEYYENGRAFLYGTDGKEVDLKEAQSNFEKAKEAGKMEANFYLGVLCDWYEYPQIDYEQARSYYEACGDDPYAQISLGFLYEYGQGVDKDREKAEELFRAAIDQGCVEGYCGRARLAQEEGDYITAFGYYRRAVKGSEPIYVSGAMSYLGTMYRDGLGTDQSYAKAWEWYERAATLNNPSAMNNMGYMCQHGLGVEEDYARAWEWYEKAVELNSASAMANLGNMCRDGLGVEEDYAQALEWYEKAAALNDSDAINNIGYMYYAGLGVEQDYGKALEWYEKAAALYNATAMGNIGYMYYAGLGVEQDYGEALEWFERAAEFGNENAQENADYIKSMM